ncbi:MAG: hypothetical protein COZ37_04730 [bacterium (Candidatus Ratteibacteria) CG_4_10_14_3_um_filter_41_18]|uniref:HEPN domain-containing protein n=3 Tax=Candidatus Ratteibacteria TaxID=2979319 RepID=A0A2M7YFI6_9BACT|nr:MAG: hypothetical protein AUJ76_01545 [Candidatus Omnitrophica bacterium CG1_02_41_171]PIW34228.1 MAG: hypothetical protein COW28_00365 [bacterium (Candidatus Ratteibacteria) CG15_BIG_FIL_POST_REV_8_21_14_020_41_12]PIX77049.1 MAG: hypothetical protein COZ37_04730 [bacterium (Candidatus Ratteibacteria) CG_4_10_14_3_um_filter_41_18]PJA61726.1 MAG: hypothetical protein CO162_04790 [bacterium (Candidatus Ratteibacteria) CG_4_9_14_3_um_filter_41_21]HCG76583.1 hypothetical protein [bacterium]
MSYDKFIEEYLSKSFIKKQEVGFDQINKMVKQANKELNTCVKILEMSSELSYTSAYSAMLYTGRALMLLKGYRAIGVNKHKTIVEFIGVYVGEEEKILMEKFDNMRKKRNLLTYEPWRLNISKTDAENALKSAREFVSFIMDKIKEENPQIEFKF